MPATRAAAEAVFTTPLHLEDLEPLHRCKGFSGSLVLIVDASEVARIVVGHLLLDARLRRSDGSEAALLHERGEDLPIILDDALVFCDDDRIELMFDALNRAARTQQVIVLTCRGKSFRTLGGKALAIEPARGPR